MTTALGWVIIASSAFVGVCAVLLGLALYQTPSNYVVVTLSVTTVTGGVERYRFGVHRWFRNWSVDELHTLAGLHLPVKSLCRELYYAYRGSSYRIVDDASLRAALDTASGDGTSSRELDITVKMC